MKITFVPVIYDCNDNCISCPVPRKKNKKNPEFEDIKKEIDYVLTYSKHIEINGGEPTLRKDLLKILGYIERKNPSEIGLLTNAQTFYYEKFAKEIAKIKNLKIITTLYGHNSTTHDAITRTPGSFKHKIAGIKHLLKNNLSIELRILLHRLNYKHFKDIVHFITNNFNKKDFNKIIVMNAKLTERAKENKKVVAEKLTNIAKNMEKPIKQLSKNGYYTEIYHFPHCILPKNLQQYSKGITADNKEVVFSKNCNPCLKRKECSKIWKSYLYIFGSNEFKAIK